MSYVRNPTRREARRAGQPRSWWCRGSVGPRLSVKRVSGRARRDEPSTLITFIPGLTSRRFTRLMAPGKILRASFCMPTEGTVKGSASASPRNAGRSNIVCTRFLTSREASARRCRSGDPGPRVISLIAWPPGHERFAPANIFRRSPRLILVAAFPELTTTAMSSV